MRDKSIMREISERFLALALTLVMLIAVIPAFSIDADAAEVDAADTGATVASGNGTWISGKLTYTWEATSNGTSGNGAAGTVSASSNTLTVTATNSKEVSGCSTTAAEATTTSVTVTNASSYPLLIKTLTSNKATVGGVSQGDTIASGATFTITVTAPAVTNSTKVTGTVAIAVEEQTSVNITLKPSPYVSYTVNGKTVAQNGSDQTFTTNAGTTINLPTITVPSGYEFKGWKIGNKALSTASSFTADAGYTVFPVIVTAGTDISAANFKVGNNTYTFWEDAVTAAVSGSGTMFVNLEDVALPTNVLDNLLPASGGTYVKSVSDGGVEYILPSGVTLVVPKDTSTTVHTTTPEYKYEAHVNPTPFRTLTVPNGAKITVNGSVSVDSKVCAQGQNASSWNGTPSGPHGKIVMKTGSKMTFNSGANLYCYGYINGDGNVKVNSGATVYELFQFRDWRGGTATNNLKGNSERIFPMNQYYVQNVEAPMTLYKGATEKVCSCVNMSSDYYPTDQIEFIGSNGMFKLTGNDSDYITKRYHANVDRLEIAVHGNMTVNALNVKITGLPLIGTIDMKSADYVLPLNNMNIWIQSGTTSIASSQTYGVAFLPSSKLTVDQNAAFTVNAPTYFYDADDWGIYAADSAKLVPVGYSTANGTTAIRTEDNLKDAELDVNGTLTVSNKLYTTAHGANITSSEGTGQINFSAACATSTTTTYQYDQKNSKKDPITCNNAWLQNGDESYSKTIGTGTSTWKYDKPGEHWYRYLVDFNFNGNRVARDYYCEDNDIVTYDASWLSGLGASVTSGTATAAVSGTNVNVTGVTADSVVTLTGTPAEYIPTFVLSEKEYEHYQLYNSGTLESTEIDGVTYYIVDQASSALAVGTAYAAPTDASMGVTAANHNTITWNMSGLSATSGNPYLGTVPRGETAGEATYIYGFYTGVVAHNSWNDQYYDTLIGAFEVLPQDVSATITMLADCGTFDEDESTTVAYTAYPSNNITLDLNGHHATGRIVNGGSFTLELNGGTLDCHTGATAASANYKGMATVINNGTMTIQDTAGGGMIVSDATSSSSGSDGSAVIRNNAGATLTVTGKASNDLLTIKENQTEVTYNSSYGYYAYNYGIYNLGRITALTNVDVTTAHSRTTGVNIYNYNTGVIDLISGGHMYAYSGSSIFNYGGTITTIDGLSIDGKNGITNRNIRGGSQANGWTVAEADIGKITTITNCDIQVGQYAIYNHARITTIKDSTLIAQPDTAQVDTRGDGLATASDGNIQCYSLYNSNEWWYNTNIWKQVDNSSGGYTRVNYYKEDEQCRPSIGTIENCNIYAKNTSTSASYGQYAFVNYGVINKIGGTTAIEAFKHPDNAKSIVSYYGMHNLGGGIIKSIEGTVNVSVSGIGAVYNDGAFTTQINYTYGNKVGGNITYQKNIYGEPSTINSITCSGTWSCGGSNSYYYALMNSGYIGAINSTDLTLTGGYNVLYNATGSANSTYEINRYYTDVATASTEYERDTHYVKNLEKGSTIGTVNGITINVKGTNVYQGLNNQGHIGTLSNVTVGFADGATNHTSNYPLVLNGDSRYQSYTETILTNRTAETDPHLTVSSGIVTRYDRDYTYTLPPTIDTIDNLTVTSIGLYAFRNAGHIGELKNSTITGTQYSLHNYAAGPYTERQTRQYYSGSGIFGTSKNAGELNKHYKRNPAEIDTIDNCTITTPANTYAMFNSGHVGTIKNSTLTAGTTSAKAYALANSNSQEREYTRDLESILYVTANSTTSCKAYYGSGGESDVVTYDYDVPVIDLIGEGNTIKATSTVVANTGIINEINSGTGTPTTITGSTAKGSTIYNYSCVLDTRTTTTPYTAATAASTSGTKGTAVNTDVNQSGAQIGTIKNVYINANGNGIINGDGNSGKTPTIGEIGEGTEIYAHCTTAGYHAIYNKANAKVASITGGVYTTTKATTNAYKNDNTDPALATVISGGDFKGMSASRANAIFEPDNTNRQTYAEGKVLSSASHSVNFNNGTTVASGTGYYYINNAYTVSYDMQDHGTAPDSQTVEAGKKFTKPDSPAVNDIVTEDSGAKFKFGGWYADADCTEEFDFTAVPDESKTVYAKWTALYTVTWKNGDTVIETDENVPAGSTPTYDGETPTKASTAQFEYSFTGWSPAISAVNGDVTYTAQFSETARTYTVTWKNGDTVIETDENVSYGTMPSYDGAEPTKAADAQYSYTFAGWDPFVAAVSGNVTYTAQFNSTVNEYTITWIDGNGETLKTDAVAYGQTPEYSGATPTKNATTEKTYTFNNTWSPAITSVTGAATYTAQFDEAARKYTITWNNDDGTLINTTEVAYGTKPTHADATKTATAQYTYTFTGWTPTIVNVTGEATYTATFSSTVNEYDVTFNMNGHGGAAPQTQTIAYGGKVSKPSTPADGALETDTSGNEYRFDGWYKNSDCTTAWKFGSDTVTGATTIYAKWTNVHTVVFDDQNASTSNTTAVVAADETVTVPPVPAKSPDPHYSYTPTSWKNETTGATVNVGTTVTASDDVTYTPVYTQTVNKYEVSWVDEDGTPLANDTVEAYGNTPDCPLETVPTKASTAQYTYTFSHWEVSVAEWNVSQIVTEDGPASTGASPKDIASTGAAAKAIAATGDGELNSGIVELTGKTTYTAVFTSTVNKYTVTWMNGTTVLETDTNVPYGTAPSYNGTIPTKEKDANYSYTFAGWGTDGETVLSSLPEVTGNATYKAAFNVTPLAFKHSITLDGEIGVSFYIPTVSVDNPSNTTVKMSWGPDSGFDHGEAEFAIKDLQDNNVNDINVIFHADQGEASVGGTPIAKAKINGSFYQFTAFVAAKQMADVVTVKIYDGDTLAKTDTYRVADYCYEVINGVKDCADDAAIESSAIYKKMCAADNTMTVEKFKKLLELCKAMLTYGSNAQVQFSYNTEAEQLADKDLEDYTYTAATAADFAYYYTTEYASVPEGMTYYGASMQLETETTYTVWLRYTDPGYEPPTATATVKGNELKVGRVKVEGNYDAYYVRYNILNLPANLLTDDIYVVYNNGDTAKKYNVKTYFYIAMASGNDTLKNTITSLYNYNQAAVGYFASGS